MSGKVNGQKMRRNRKAKTYGQVVPIPLHQIRQLIEKMSPICSIHSSPWRPQPECITCCFHSYIHIRLKIGLCHITYALNPSFPVFSNDPLNHRHFLNKRTGKIVTYKWKSLISEVYCISLFTAWQLTILTASQSATWAMTSCVAGLIVGKVFPLMASTHSLLMNACT